MYNCIVLILCTGLSYHRRFIDEVFSNLRNESLNIQHNNFYSNKCFFIQNQMQEEEKNLMENFIFCAVQLATTDDFCIVLICNICLIDTPNILGRPG